MRVTHGGLAIELPEGWQDRSTLLFVGPELPAGSPHQNQEQANQAISITLGSTYTDDARQAAHDQWETLCETQKNGTLLEESVFESALGLGWALVQEFEISGSLVRQLATTTAVGKVMVYATASAPTELFDVLIPQLQTILKSLNLNQRG